MPFVSCSKFNQSQATQDQAIADLAQELLNKQNALNDCSGNPLAGTVPTCAQMNTAISSAIAGGTSPTGAAGGDLEGTYPNPTVKDQAIVDAVTGSTAVQKAVAGVFNRCDGTDMPAGASLIECSAKGTDIPYLVGGVIPATQLPAYVDDVLEFPALANFPATGEAGKIYIDASTGKTYRWNGNSYTEISASAGITVQDEGIVLTTAATSLNFVGNGVQATNTGGSVTVTTLQASETQAGTVELATPAEAVAGISNTTAVTPQGLQAAISSIVVPTSKARRSLVLDYEDFGPFVTLPNTGQPTILSISGLSVSTNVGDFTLTSDSVVCAVAGIYYIEAENQAEFYQNKNVNTQVNIQGCLHVNGIGIVSGRDTVLVQSVALPATGGSGGGLGEPPIYYDLNYSGMIELDVGDVVTFTGVSATTDNDTIVSQRLTTANITRISDA